MQITNIKVNNYKSLVDFKSTKFGDINFIYGLNNSGKSNFFEFLELLFQERISYRSVRYDDDGVEKVRLEKAGEEPYWNSQIYDKPFIFYKDKRKNNIEFDVSIKISNDKYPSIKALSEEGFLYISRDSTPLNLIGEIQSINASTSQVVLTKAKIGKSIIYENNGSEKIFETVNKTSTLFENREVFEEILGLLSNSVYLIKSDRKIERERFNDFESAELESGFKKWLFNLYVDSQKHPEFQDLTKFLEDFKISSKSKERLKENADSFPFTKTNIGFSKFDDELEIMLSTKNGRYPLKNFGTGIKQIIYILTHIFNTNSKIIIIEELELNLSPEYQEFVISNLTKFVKDNYLTQVFFSSHSDYLYRNDYKMFKIEIDKNGKSSIQTEKYNDLKQIRRRMLEE
jgi:AAA15 family ATPase/GTPase